MCASKNTANPDFLQIHNTYCSVGSSHGGACGQPQNYINNIAILHTVRYGLLFVVYEKVKQNMTVIRGSLVVTSVAVSNWLIHLKLLFSVPGSRQHRGLQH